ncbi:RHOMBOID-like 1 [Hibiscus trionum]|uniref:RHOMBOID-like protein n=1 Tax=Hibiscus trionum TaxID=183268 RepID=A0A9W7MD34_HIBTR|nr:RHOMBOID-like 1 [Hibiscus trionum]
MDSKIEIKVTNPKKVDAMGHPAGPGHSSAPPPASQTSHGHWPRHREGHQEGWMVDFKPFKKWVPWLIPSFVLVNIFMFIMTMYINDCPETSNNCVAKFLGRFSFQPFYENPLLGPSSSTLEKMGALEVDKVVKKHQAWRLISCIWLHAGVFHLLANMLSLLFIGIRLEQEFGFVRIGLLYLISGFGGSLMSSLFIRSGIHISVGASGALFGLLGSMLSELITNWTIYANKFAALLTLVLVIIINLATGVLPHVDNFAHIGGFISGFLLGFVLLIRPQFGYISQKNIPPGYTAPRKPKHKTYQYVLWIVSLILLIALFATVLVYLIRGVNMNDRCSWCHYMSCIPTPLWSCDQQQVYCQSTKFGKSLNLTCISNGKSEMFALTEETSSQVQQLCSKLCS